MTRSEMMIPAIVVALAACGGGDAPGTDRASAEPAAEMSANFAAETQGAPADTLSPETIERGRLDADWKNYVHIDRSAAADSGTDPEKWEDISAESVNGERTHLPLSGDVAGPSVLKVQALLDRAYFSPGILDGRWGKNTEKAVYWFQESHGLPATGQVDDATFERLTTAAGGPDRLVATVTLTGDDVGGPFVSIPSDVYARADLDCLCYESKAEQLSERYHSTPELLTQLNPDVDFASLETGDQLAVPNVRESGPAPHGTIAKIVISDGGHYLHGVDADGNILYHFPSTLGSDYAPSPDGDFSVASIHWDPKWHYKPDLLTGVPDDEEPAVLPAGPNNAVGIVWMQLSKPHYGIHGTSAPATIGYATSHGCIRLTNWDARFLGHHIDAGVPVSFVDSNRRGA